MALQMFQKKLMDVAAKWYQTTLAKDLNKIGLRYEDLLNNHDPYISEALSLADPDVVKGRSRRIKRASDLCFKGKIFTDYKSESSMTDPFKEEIWDDIQKLRKRNQERDLMNMHKW